MTELSELAADAFIFGYPLVYNLTSLQVISGRGMGGLPATQFNEFGFAHKLANPSVPFVSVNNDTVYALAQLDLSGGPLTLHVPDTDGAYYVLQFVDVWTNNFAYLGRRATGTAEGEYLIAGPVWDGVNPDNLPVITAPTDIVSIVGRLACSGPDDLSRVLKLQQQFTLTPTDGSTPLVGIPSGNLELPKSLQFWDQLRLWSQAFPPGGDDLEFLAGLGRLGLLDHGDPYMSAASELVAALTEGLAAGQTRLEAAARTEDPDAVNGWQMSLHLFDYNRSAFGIGTIDTDKWKIADRDVAYLTRAVAARNALWGNHAYEAVYPQVYVDDNGDQLNGSRQYEITFTELPPVDAFWSLTMYSTPDYFLVENQIERYSIGDRTSGIYYAADGSLTIYLQQHEPEDADRRANWLPTPQGDFRPMLRMYQPRDAVLNGSYSLPAIRRVS
ncbi:DUF1254 domain-containing protein [Leifsonia sp. Leaf264]|uniref:DUF1254 domain-containing protein n=1 Tax=Leifsonia sp. Leaf264 TaxID=1736314 RepID=UPI0006F792A9|nr:DUF1254 domain-containing protein [Leifsonia sp. Leaf264]KQO97493.1 ATP synthase subunit alpha [Leifsonia sp. Leaf264]